MTYNVFLWDVKARSFQSCQPVVYILLDGEFYLVLLEVQQKCQFMDGFEI